MRRGRCVIFRGMRLRLFRRFCGRRLLLSCRKSRFGLIRVSVRKECTFLVPSEDTEVEKALEEVDEAITDLIEARQGPELPPPSPAAVQMAADMNYIKAETGFEGIGMAQILGLVSQGEPLWSVDADCFGYFCDG